jgi:pimeloyl-ACP methyl ester carboxylesterase
MPPVDEVPIDPSGRDYDLDPVPLLRDLTTPTLVLYGAADALVPRAMGIDVVASIDNPNLTLKVYDGADHGIRVKRWPSWLRPPVYADGYLDLLCDFIANPRESMGE